MGANGQASFDLVDLMKLQQLSELKFQNYHNEPNSNGRLYGGQLMGQVLTAALRTIAPDRVPTMLQLVFLAGAHAAEPIIYEVVKLQDGKLFSSRMVLGRQNDRIIVSANVSGQRDGFSQRHQRMPYDGLPIPEMTSAIRGPVREVVSRQGGTSYDVAATHPWVEWRVIDLEGELHPRAPGTKFRYWVRVKHPLSDDPRLHAGVLAYLSDWWTNYISIAPYTTAEPNRRFYVASLNHCLWLHTSCRTDKWMLFETESPWANTARGLAFGHIYQNGMLVASLVQESSQFDRQ